MNGTGRRFFYFRGDTRAVAFVAGKREQNMESTSAQRQERRCIFSFAQDTHPEISQMRCFSHCIAFAIGVKS